MLISSYRQKYDGDQMSSICFFEKQHLDKQLSIPYLFNSNCFECFVPVIGSIRKSSGNNKNTLYSGQLYIKCFFLDVVWVLTLAIQTKQFTLKVRRNVSFNREYSNTRHNRVKMEFITSTLCFGRSVKISFPEGSFKFQKA